MAIRKIKLSPLSQEVGNLTDEGLSSRRRSRNAIRDTKGNASLVLQTAESITSVVSRVGAVETGKENSIFRQTTAPAHLNGRFWLDTSVTPHVLNVSNGTIWTRATPTQASEVGAFSSSDGSALSGRVTSAESTITQQAGQIATKVEQSTFNTLGDRVSSAESTITQQAGQIALRATKTEVTQAVDNIQVGGRNLLPNTDFDGIAKRYNKPAGGSTEGGFFFTPTVQVESGIQYTLSLKIKGKANVNFFQINTGGNLVQTLILKANLSETDYKLVTLTFTVPIGITLNLVYIATAFGNTPDGDWFEIEPNSLKLEKGNKATDWTPAPEDVDSKINGIETRISEAELRITPTAITSTVRSSTEYINDLGGKVDNSTLTNNYSTTSQTALLLESKVSSTDLATTLTNYSTINQTADSIDLLFKKSGMQNMFVNSDMSLGLDNFAFYWQTGGSMSLDIRADIWGNYENTFQIYQSTASVTTIAQSFLYNLVPGSVYTVGCLIAGHRSNNEIQVVNWADNQIVGSSAIVSNGLGGVNLSNWKTISVTFTATDTTMRLRHVSVSTAADGFYWAKHFQLNLGHTLAPYSKRQGEFKTAKYTFDGDSAKFYDADFELWRGGVRKLFFNTTTGNYTFDGHIITDSGSIAGFSLIENYGTILTNASGRALTAGSGSTRVGMSPALRSPGGFDYAFWAGNDNPQLAPFRVLNNGEFRSSNAVIGGWQVGGSTISRGNLSLDASSGNGRIDIGGSVLFSNSANRLNLTGALAVSGTVTTGSLGNTLIPTTDNMFTLGIATFRWQTVWINTSAINGSDRRLKEEIKEIEFANDFILNLKPVQFKLIDGQSGRKHYGFIAQEVKETMTKVGIDDFGGYVDPNTTKGEDEEEQMLGLRYEEFIAPMVATIQHLEKRISELETKVS